MVISNVLYSCVDTSVEKWSGSLFIGGLIMASNTRGCKIKQITSFLCLISYHWQNQFWLQADYEMLFFLPTLDKHWYLIFISWAIWDHHNSSSCLLPSFSSYHFFNQNHQINETDPNHIQYMLISKGGIKICVRSTNFVPLSVCVRNPYTFSYWLSHTV